MIIFHHVLLGTTSINDRGGALFISEFIRFPLVTKLPNRELMYPGNYLDPQAAGGRASSDVQQGGSRENVSSL